MSSVISKSSFNAFRRLSLSPICETKKQMPPPLSSYKLSRLVAFPSAFACHGRGAEKIPHAPGACVRSAG